MTMYQRHLPHWRQDGATYFVTFRLHDSLPQDRLRELDGLRSEWERRNPPPRSDDVLEELARDIFLRVNRWLDQGMGSCVLKDATHSAFATEAMHKFDDSRYELDCYVVMPNHVHAVVRPLISKSRPLEELVGSWKKYSSRWINDRLGRSGDLWQEESYDRIIRDEEHLYRTIQYIGRNPGKAGMARGTCPLWIRPEWEELSWTFERDEMPDGSR